MVLSLRPVCLPACSRQRDVVFVADVSGSLEESDVFDIQLTFMQQVVQGLDFRFGRARCAFVTFAGGVYGAHVQFYLDQYTSRQDVLNAISLTEVEFQTDIALGLSLVRTEILRPARGDRNGVPNIVILLSDGKPTENADRISGEATRLKRDADIYAVSIGPSVNRGQMLSIASQPTSRFEYYLETRTDVDTIASELLNDLCT